MNAPSVDDAAPAARVLVVTGMAFEAAIAAASGADVVYRSAAGAGAFEAALAERLRRPCAGILSFGVAGGLDAALAPGAVIIASRVIAGADAYATDIAWSAALRAGLPGSLSGVLAASDIAVTGLAGKAALRQACAALAVDMESHIAARQAQVHGLPFAACRIVLDPADRAVPSAALVALGEDGRTDLAALLGELLRHPGQLPALLRLGRDASVARGAMRKARKALGEDYFAGAAGATGASGSSS